MDEFQIRKGTRGNRSMQGCCMTAPRLYTAAFVLAALALASCASDQDQPYRAPSQPDRPRSTIFLSPAGQPFHAASGEAYPVVQWFAQADRDHDGRITRKEFQADFELFFHILDVNHDGLIDSFEVDDYERKVAPEILSILEQPREAPPTPESGEQGIGEIVGARPAPDSGRGNSSARLSVLGASAYSLLTASEPVASADADFDGKITLAEFLAAADRRFHTLDAKARGYLTLDGLPRTPDQIAVEGRKPETR